MDIYILILPLVFVIFTIALRGLCAMKLWTKIKLMVLPRGRYYHEEDDAPLRCYVCEETKFDYVTEDQINGIVCEYSISCSKCHEGLGYWAYGYWSPPHHYRK